MDKQIKIKILGISAFYHDAAAVIMEDGRIIAAAQEERFSRKKNDLNFPIEAIKFCLEYGGYSLDDFDAIIFYDKPFTKFERLLETFYVFAPKGFLFFLKIIPIWIKQKFFLKKLIKKELAKVGPINEKKINLLFSKHHLSHGASAFFPSPFDEAAILTIDGVGEWATASISYGEKNKIKQIKEMRFPHSVGLFYSAFTYYLGFKVNSGEYKLMGLAPYGEASSERVIRYKKIIYDNMISVKEDGSIFLNHDYFAYTTELKMCRDKKWLELFGFSKRKPESEILQCYCDLALAVQEITEDIVFKMARTAKKITGSKKLCLAGGVALNCVINGKLLKSGIFEEIWIQPAAGDAGGALGAAFLAYHMYFDKERVISKGDKMRGAYLGPVFNDSNIKTISKKYKAKHQFFEKFEDLAEKAAGLLSEGNIIGWFQGRMEFGPRALGNRSILADARHKGMQKRLNLKIKFRESFRPFAPSVLNEDAEDFFNIQKSSPYMLMTAVIPENKRKEVPVGYNGFEMKEKLACARSDFPAITHIDFSARFQTVSKETNIKYWTLINKFKQKTNCPMLINTSFNVRNEPIVCNPEDAYKCFLKTGMDYLVMGNFLFKKRSESGNN